MQITKLNKEETISILNTAESHFFDFKSKRIAPSKLTKTLSAFANAEGGELIIGIEDSPRSWNGFETLEEANAHIQVIDNLFPLGNEISYSFIESDSASGFLLKIEILKSRSIKYANDQVAYVRRSAQNLPYTSDDQINILKRNKGITSFETETVNIPKEVVTESETIKSFLDDIIPKSDPEKWLKKQLAIINELPTVFSVILFSDEPQAALPKRTGLKIYRYKTNNDEGTRESLAFQPVSVEGNAYQQIAEAVTQVTEIIEGIRIQDSNGLESIKYPKEAIHEIITNAVIHRDYEIPEDIHIRIFDNRVEVKSPGILPGHITVKNILDERFSRNPSLVRLINKFKNPPNKDIGEGLNTAFQAMKSLKLKEPNIYILDNYVNIVLKHEKLATPEESILSYLLNNSEIANRKAREICFINSENEMKRILQKMVKSDLLETVPGRTRYTAAYRLSDKGRSQANENTP